MTTNPTPDRPVNDMRELYAVQHAITDAGGTLAPEVHKAIDELREAWDRELRRAQAEVHQYRTALQGAARSAASAVVAVAEPPTGQTADRAAVLREAADDLAEFIALHGPTSRTVAGWRGAVGFLRRMAAEAQQQPETQVARHAPGKAILCPDCSVKGRAVCTADEEPPEETVHGCPPDGSGLTPCCGRTPFELPLTDRISSEAPITCQGPAS